MWIGIQRTHLELQDGEIGVKDPILNPQMETRIDILGSVFKFEHGS